MLNFFEWMVESRYPLDGFIKGDKNDPFNIYLYTLEEQYKDTIKYQKELEDALVLEQSQPHSGLQGANRIALGKKRFEKECRKALKANGFDVRTIGDEEAERHADMHEHVDAIIGKDPVQLKGKDENGNQLYLEDFSAEAILWYTPAEGLRKKGDQDYYGNPILYSNKKPINDMRNPTDRSGNPVINQQGRDTYGNSKYYYILSHTKDKLYRLPTKWVHDTINEFAQDFINNSEGDGDNIYGKLSDPQKIHSRDQNRVFFHPKYRWMKLRCQYEESPREMFKVLCDIHIPSAIQASGGSIITAEDFKNRLEEDDEGYGPVPLKYKDNSASLLHEDMKSVHRMDEKAFNKHNKIAKNIHEKNLPLPDKNTTVGEVLLALTQNDKNEYVKSYPKTMDQNQIMNIINKAIDELKKYGIEGKKTDPSSVRSYTFKVV
jgi:hypothetical protein